MPIPTALKVLSPITGIVSAMRGGGGRRGRAGETATATSGRLGAVPSFKRGGTMKKRGVAKLHKGERIKGRKRGRGRGR